ncbi:MAG: hypothetical protein JO161_05725 [Planctomycetaceae bacterium]|nr:hypothetical protein [Planctomycetaceae bacterium]
MRCAQARQSLDGQVGIRDDPAVAEHLAVCQACARRAFQAHRLRQLWEATCAPNPTSETWEMVWGSVSKRLAETDLARGDRFWSSETTVRNAPARSGQNRFVSRRGHRRALLAVMVLSQAAAILVALGWYSQIRPRASQPPVAPGLDLVIDIEEGQVPLVRWNGSKTEVLDLSSLQSSNGEDPWLVLLNDVESASNAVAMAE